MWLIGQEWKCSNAWSGLILIGRKFDQGSVKGRGKFSKIEVVMRLFSFEGLERRAERMKPRAKTERSGDNDREAPPVPMPNTEVKLSDADDSQPATARENMSLPDIIKALLFT